MKDQITRRNFLGLCGRSVAVCASSALFPLGTSSRSAWSAAIEKGFIRRKLSPYFTPMDNQMIHCELCPHGCEVDPGERGL